MKRRAPYRTAPEYRIAPGYRIAPISRTAQPAAIAACALYLGGCSGMQSALDPAGPQSGRIAALWWVTLWICAAVYVLVLAALVFALAGRRRRNREPDTPQLHPDPAREHRMARVVSGAVAATVIILLVLLVADYATGHALASFGAARPLTLEVIGHQFWWEVHYADSIAGNRVLTANEIHIPLGRPVLIKLTSRDVIHSLWIPNLHGKRDLIPGYTTTLMLEADRAGAYRGQCAEFCGHQHAQMALTVVAESDGAFDAWIAHQRASAQAPADSLARRGQTVFLSSPCVMCHAIAGTDAGSGAGPNLTHIASRPTIGAGTLANTRGNMAGWILDPQHIKPGNHMPKNILTPDDLNALLAYLESLK